MSQLRNQRQITPNPTNPYESLLFRAGGLGDRLELALLRRRTGLLLRLEL